jgi:hypothetical protein
MGAKGRWPDDAAEQADQPESIIAAVVGHKRKGMNLGAVLGGATYCAGEAVRGGGEVVGIERNLVRLPHPPFARIMADVSP